MQFQQVTIIALVNHEQYHHACIFETKHCLYSGPFDLRPPIQPGKYGLKLKVVLK